MTSKPQTRETIHYPIGYSWMEGTEVRKWATCESGQSAEETLSSFKRLHPHLIDAWVIEDKP